MTEERAKRKLSGILSADAVGYSRLMEEDETSTIRILEDSKNLMSKLIQQFKGRVVDAPGDNLLAEFSSVVDATECAVKIQQELKTKNAELPDNRQMQFRIGVNLGDVVEEAGRIYGDGVNIAARLEGLALPGGICISRTAHDHVKNKLELGYEYLGEHSVKNISEPVRVYKVLMEPEAAGKVIGEKKFIGRVSRKAAISAIIILLLVAAGVIGWNIYLQQSKNVESASIDKMAYPLPDKPSIAVLPFDNMSGDPDQEYFSDGLTEEIITGLSKVPELFVIARNSSFIYKGKPVKVQQVAEELGVRYVLEGSVQREGNRVRITAQLIDAISGHHIWSKRYDRELENIFELQDKIMMDILIEMRAELTEGEQIRISHKSLEDKKVNIEAYWKQLKSRWHFYRQDPEGFAMSKQLAEEVIELDPNYASPYVLLAFMNQYNVPLAEKYAQKALQLDDSDPWSYLAMGQLYMRKRQWEKAIDMGERALALDPNGADANNFLGHFLHQAGRFAEAIPFYEKSFRLNPYPPSWYYRNLGSAYFAVERYDDAVEVCRKGLERNPRDPYTRLVLAVAYIGQGREEEANTEAKKFLNVLPKFSIKQAKARSTQKNKIALDKFYDAASRAGFPD